MTEDAVRAEKVCYTYDGRKNVLRNLTLDIKQGEFIALLGSNGSGKSTLAKHMNALFVPDFGTVVVAGIDTKDPERLLELRSKVGMVFQNPDDQMVSSVVETDVAFGPENLGCDPQDIRRRVDGALEAVGMTRFARYNPSDLSGGQKQRVAVAGILAMEPDIVVLDEPGAMLDPRGRRAIRRVARELNERGITIVLITHFMQEALLADRVVVMHEGRVVMAGTPDEVFAQEDKIAEYALEVPLSIQLAHALDERGVHVEPTTDLKEMEERLCRLLSSR